MATSVPATAIGSPPAGEHVAPAAPPSADGEAVAITCARATVTALSARTRMPRSWPSPSSVARSTTRKTARLSSQYARKPSVTRTAVSQLASSDQSPPTRSASWPA